MSLRTRLLLVLVATVLLSLAIVSGFTYAFVTKAQLDLYALACIDVFGKRAEDLTLTYLYLASGEEVSHRVDEPEAVRGRVAEWLRGIAGGEFDPTPGDHCRWCDFRAFCDVGRAWVEERG